MNSKNHRISRRVRVVAFSLMSIAVATAFAAMSELEVLAQNAGDYFSTKEGRRYSLAFQDAIFPVFSKALGTCSETTRDTKKPASFVFVVAADGTVTRMLYSKEIPFGACIGAKLRGIKKVPRPPRDGWVVSFGASNHSAAERAKGPPDTPTMMKTRESRGSRFRQRVDGRQPYR